MFFQRMPPEQHDAMSYRRLDLSILPTLKITATQFPISLTHTAELHVCDDVCLLSAGMCKAMN